MTSRLLGILSHLLLYYARHALKPCGRLNASYKTRIIIYYYIISGIKAILQDSSVKIADDEGVSPSSSVTHEFPVICFSPRVMYNILSTALRLRIIN
jgi:hypothetical protein